MRVSAPTAPSRLARAVLSTADEQHPQPRFVRRLAPRAQLAVGHGEQLLRRVAQLAPPSQLEKARATAALRQLLLIGLRG